MNKDKKLSLTEILQNQRDFLFFNWSKLELYQNQKTFFIWGFIITWIVGIGRYWDNPRAEIWQILGLGSLSYVFVLTLILYLLIKPLAPEKWTVKNLLLFSVMTSFPAVLYAIPVERFMSLEAASMCNVIFLAIVAIWRMLLYAKLLSDLANFKALPKFAAFFSPLLLIVFTLASLNLEHVIFRIMGGLMENEKTANDAAYVIILLITYCSIYLSPIIILSYIFCIFKRKSNCKVEL